MKTKQFRRLISFCSVVTLAAALLLAAQFRLQAGDTSSWGFSLANLDRSCKPCDNFYEFAMGSWMKSNPIPPEYSTWGTFTQLSDNNLTALRGILETASKSAAPAGSDQQKIGDFYASCMDIAAIDAAGLKPIAADLSAIDAVSNRKALDAAIVLLQRQGADVLFRFFSGQDYKDSSKVIAQASQGGLGMPDRDYYLRDDDKSKQIPPITSSTSRICSSLLETLLKNRTPNPKPSWPSRAPSPGPPKPASNFAIPKKITTSNLSPR